MQANRHPKLPIPKLSIQVARFSSMFVVVIYAVPYWILDACLLAGRWKLVLLQWKRMHIADHFTRASATLSLVSGDQAQSNTSTYIKFDATGKSRCLLSNSLIHEH
jgi:hypothetical protein